MGDLGVGEVAAIWKLIRVVSYLLSHFIGPATAPPDPDPPWASPTPGPGVCLPHDEGPGPTSPGSSEARRTDMGYSPSWLTQTCAVCSRLFLLPLSLHPSSLPARLPHRLQVPSLDSRQHADRVCLTRSPDCIRSNSVANPFIAIYLSVAMS